MLANIVKPVAYLQFMPVQWMDKAASVLLKNTEFVHKGNHTVNMIQGFEFANIRTPTIVALLDRLWKIAHTNLPESNEYTLSAVTWTICITNKYDVWSEINNDAVKRNMQ